MFFVTCPLKYDIRMLLLLREVAAILNLSFHGRTFQKPAAGVALRQPHWEHNQPNNLPCWCKKGETLSRNVANLGIADNC